ncbi:hypothetical protein [Ornithinibacillus halotolerans]|uniref:Uncharacterized protein n=1 Tax=Ornithinibacillus halotolerans TaxID=1274357 RepID=A0A916RLU2_9BACI|nr:hypothetical protein [Ornithinibacillus halotolerans]GGA61093.1 hypothetical protein GCM10008025_01360 [Ornithinibacillus halotolerans]
MKELTPENHKDDLEKLIEDINEGTSQSNKESNEELEEINKKDVEPKLNNELVEISEEINEQKNEVVNLDEELIQENIDRVESDDEIIELNDKVLHPEINVLNLPPRREVHSQNNQKVHFKISKPFIRLAFVIILLAVVLGISFYFNPNLLGL